MMDCWSASVQTQPILETSQSCIEHKSYSTLTGSELDIVLVIKDRQGSDERKC